MKKAFVLFILSISFLHVIGQDLYPLANGNEWKYTTIKYTDNVVTDTVERIIKVDSSFMYQDTLWYDLNEFGYHFYVRNNSEGQLELPSYFNETKDTLTGSVFFRNFKNARGTTYSDQDGNSIKVYKKRVKITTPVGTFKCARYVIFSGDTVFGDYYFKEGIGIVYVVTYEMGGRNILEHSLKSFTIN